MILPRMRLDWSEPLRPESSSRVDTFPCTLSPVTVGPDIGVYGSQVGVRVVISGEDVVNLISATHAAHVTHSSVASHDPRRPCCPITG